MNLQVLNLVLARKSGEHQKRGVLRIHDIGHGLSHAALQLLGAVLSGTLPLSLYNIHRYAIRGTFYHIGRFSGRACLFSKQNGTAFAMPFFLLCLIVLFFVHHPIIRYVSWNSSRAMP